MDRKRVGGWRVRLEVMGTLSTSLSAKMGFTKPSKGLIILCMTKPLFDRVKQHLEFNKGRLPWVAQDSGISFATIRKIASGEVSDPRISTVQRLYDYFEHRAPYKLKE